jgi:hypothetical protein
MVAHWVHPVHIVHYVHLLQPYGCRKNSRCHNNDPLEFLENKQVFVTGDNRLCLTTDRTPEHGKVFQIAQVNRSFDFRRHNERGVCAICCIGRRQTKSESESAAQCGPRSEYL